MVQVIRVLVGYPLLFILKKIMKRFSFFANIVFVAIILYLSSDYIAENFTNSLVSSTKEDPKNVTKEITIKKGDTLGAILRKLELPNEDIRSLIKLAKAEKITSRLKIGQILIFNYGIDLIKRENSDLIDEKLTLNRMALRFDKIKSIEFVKQDGKFEVHRISAPLKKLITKYEATIDTSVIASLQKVGMNTASVIDIINTFSYQIDFQRQIKSGDKITVITEKFITDKNEFSHHGKVLHASIQTKKKEYNIYRYSPTGNNKDAQFFSEKGSSIKRSLLRTPVKYTRISGTFGYRKKHPVLGYGAAHKGVDFAASIGTPIKSAGDGVITFKGWKGGYGRIMIIKHNKTLSTAYAHASRFAKNIKKGSRVKQGQVIAYVGKSGRVTGPHLHFEVRINGKQVNPMKFKSIPGVKLTGAKLSKFNKYKSQLKGLTKKLSEDIELAAVDILDVKLF